MQARRAALTNALSPCQADDIHHEINILKAGFSVGGIDETTAAVQVAVYVRALEGFPAWAVIEACQRFQAGRNATPWKPNFCPTSAEVAAECRAIIGPIQDELIPLRDVLDAEVYPDPDPDQATRMAAVMNWEKNVRPAMAAKGYSAPKESPEDALIRLKAEGLGPVIVIGAELRGKFDNMIRGK